MAQLVLQLAAARHPYDRRVTGVALHGRGRHRAAAVQLARGGAWDPGQRVEAGPDDQLRPRPSTVPLATGAVGLAAALPAEFDQRVVLALPVAARVIFDGLHERLQRGAERRAALGLAPP